MKIFNFINKDESRKRAIAYYRHSAEDKQENSVPIQRDFTHKFCDNNNINLIHEEADEGKTGLLANRPGFNRIFKDWIENPKAPDFDYVLVFDVSRWGRFQNQNEAPYYEFICNKKGKEVIYVSKGFIKEEYKKVSHIQTTMERIMAADYSEQLSNKVFYGSVKVSEQGYSAGGTALYGMNRLLLDVDKKPICILKKGEHKTISNQRVTFIPSNDKTTEIIKEIFSLFTKSKCNPEEIATELNSRKIASPGGRRWDKKKVLHVLTNETYIGTRIYNKTWNRLKKGKRDNPKSEWVYCYNAFEPIISKEIFDKAQEKLFLSKSKQRDEINIIKKINKNFKESLEKLLVSKGFPEEDLFTIKKNFPVCFSVFSTSSWCFAVTENMRKYSSILCFGISLNEKRPIQKIFMLPSNEFNIGRFRIISDNEKDLEKYVIAEENIEKELFSLIKELKGGNMIFNNVN